MLKSKTTIIALLGLSACVAGLRAERVQYSDLPLAVRSQIDRERNGGTIKDIDRTTSDGKTVYKVHIQREGADSTVKINPDGTVLKDDSTKSFSLNAGDGKVEVNNGEKTHVFSTDKSDGKILGILPAPSAKKNEAKIEADTDKGVHVDTQVDTSKSAIGSAPSSERDTVNVQSNPAPADRHVDVNVGDGKAEVKTGEKTHVFSTDKSDGKILGILPAPSAKKNEAKIEADTDHGVHVDSHLDANHPAVGTAPAYDKGAKAESEVQVDRNGARVDVDTGTKRNNGLFSKDDGKILKVIPAPSASEKGEMTMNDLPARVQDTIRREAGSDQIVKIQDSKYKGVPSYKVEIQCPGKNRKLEVAADGQILKDNFVREGVGKGPAIETETQIQK